ncbi:MAG: c-type cytochrome [Acidobacteria bacterium]|nr:c-type cytochrome [Acidobacteriota bacterium]
MNGNERQNDKGRSCSPAIWRGLILGFYGFLWGGMILVPSLLGRNPDPKEGMKVFQSKGCAQCHPIMGEGGNVGPDLTRTPSAGDGLELAAAMWSHGPQMWQRMSQEHVQLPKFEEGEMEDLFAFLTMASSLDEPGDVETGRRLFQTKRCAECHAVRGKGGKVGPDLATVASNRNPVGWVAAMWNHAPRMMQAMEGRGVAFPTFQDNEMADLQNYIRLMGNSPGEDRLYDRYIRPPNADTGETLFRTKQCVQCHSLAGYGGKIGPDLSSVALPRKYGAIALAMWNHAPQMHRMMATLAISLPQFEAQELADLLSYLSSLSMKRPGDPAAGASAFAAKGCSSCHTVTGGATSVGPNLSSLQGDFTPLSISGRMWNHGPAMLQIMEKSDVSWPVFTSKELADTLAFLKSIQAGSSQGSPSEAARNGP